MTLKNVIFIVGEMGSGKSTFGSILAEQMRVLYTVSVKISAEEFESINYSEADRILKEPRPRPTQIVVPIDPADLIEEEDV